MLHPTDTSDSIDLPLTAWDRNPYEVHEEEVKPEVECLGSGIDYASIVVVDDRGAKI